MEGQPVNYAWDPEAVPPPAREGAALYTRALALRLWCLAAVTSWDPIRRDLLGRPTLDSAARLLHQVSVALTFPTRRDVARDGADDAILELRLHLRVAAQAGILGSGPARYAHAELDELGRMLGGWKRATPDRHPPRPGPLPAARSPPT